MFNVYDNYMYCSFLDHPDNIYHPEDVSPQAAGKRYNINLESGNKEYMPLFSMTKI